MAFHPASRVLTALIIAFMVAECRSSSLQLLRCDPGFYVSAEQCAPCDIGSISTGGSVTACTPCKPGFTTTAPGSSKCNACQPGFGSVKCNACPAGKFNRGGNQLPCRFCSCRPAVCRVVTCDPTKGCVSSNAPAGTGCLFRGTAAGQCSTTGTCVALNTDARGPNGACKTTALLPAAINTKSKADVTTAFLTLLYPHLKCYVFGFLSSSCCTNPGFPGSTSSCSPYQPGPGWQEEVGKVMNFFRLMAGSPVVALNNTDWTSLSLAGALMCAAQQDISHQVAAADGWKCFSDAASKAVASSNLAFGNVGPQAMIGYVHDPGSNNVQVGHRRWLLRPNTQVMASGDGWHDQLGKQNPDKPTGYVYGPANDMYVMDLNNYWATPPKAAPVMMQKPFPFSSWPPAGGYLPYQLVFPRWHVSMEGLGFERTVPNFSSANIFGNAQVTVTSKSAGGPATQVTTSVVQRSPLYLVFEPSLPRVTASPYYNWLMVNPKAEVTYTVKITGISISGASEISYDVIVYEVPGTDVLQGAPFIAASAGPAGDTPGDGAGGGDDAAAAVAAAAAQGCSCSLPASCTLVKLQSP